MSEGERVVSTEFSTQRGSMITGWHLVNPLNAPLCGRPVTHLSQWRQLDRKWPKLPRIDDLPVKMCNRCLVLRWS